MPTLTSIPAPLTLSEQLDAMLAGWLDRHDPAGERRTSDANARAVLTVVDSAVPEIEDFCARWDLTPRRSSHVGGRWAVLVVAGSALPIQGFTEITGMYRR